MLDNIKTFFKKKPKFTLKTDGQESDRGIKVEMDWNPEFIEYIKMRGCVGHNEQEAVAQYLVYMLRCITRVDAETDEPVPSIDTTRPEAFAEAVRSGNSRKEK